MTSRGPLLRHALRDGTGCSWCCFVDVKAARAAEAEIMNGVAGFQAAAESVTHERGEISAVLGAFGAAAAEQLTVQSCVPTRIAGDEGGVEIGDPFPNQAVQIADAVKVGRPFADCRKRFG